MQTGTLVPIARHIQVLRRKAINLSGARNRPRLSESGTTALIASSFSVGSARKWTSVV